MRPVALTLVLFAWPAGVYAQPVVVRTDPPRATLVCDGVVVGITPVRLDPERPHTCTLFARGHENLSFVPATITGVFASYRLVPVTAPSPPPPAPATEGTHCGEIDRHTGLIRVCFAGETTPRREAPGARIPRRAAVACGAVDPATGLIRVCFAGERTSAAPPANTPTPDTTPPSTPCGHLDPSTGLMVPCFTTPRHAPHGRRRPVPCGSVDPTTGLIRICF